MKRHLHAAAAAALILASATAAAEAAVTIHNVTDVRVTFQTSCANGETIVWRLDPRQTSRPACHGSRQIGVRVLTEKPTGTIVASGVIPDGGSYVLQRDRDGDVVLVPVIEI